MQPKKKRSISLTQYIISLIIIAIVASGATVAVFGIYSRKEATQLRGSSIQSIDYLNQVIKMAYFDKVDDQKLIDGALKGMVEALDDPYSSYFSKSEAKDFDDSISGSFEGIGAVMTMQDGVPTIAEPPIKGSPAEKAQLRANDKILKINDKKVSDKSLNDVVKEVRGKKGSTVKLEVARDKEVFNVEIKRDKIPVESVKSNIDKNHKNIGYIDIKSFNDTTSDEFNKAIESLEKEGAKGLIIDVRGNPGGILPQVEEITSRFLRNGETIVQFEDRNKKESKDTASEQLDEGKKINLPTVLLVDQDSASASEIMAAALKDSGRFDVVGTKTFGKGTVQSLIPLGDQGEAKLTISKWLTPKGQWIHKKGVEPTVDVEYPEYLKNRMIDTSKTYREGMISDDVKIINSDLQALGYQVDGKSDTYTNTTKTAVSEFQEKEDLTVTGEVDKDTAVKIVESVINYWKANDTQYQKAMDLVLEKVK
ncbi:hypothetical protein CBF37_04885 [Vagococcus vulneris]|uniref:PDZ domain-containing protein n=2 Tax=Vagococcus vulneris TaxID=1977869 RepID=A0A429ZZD8_9ENTE|nr:hypothetical protein CBF37_04885 [Vagococcus vulneris]